MVVLLRRISLTSWQVGFGVYQSAKLFCGKGPRRDWQRLEWCENMPIWHFWCEMNIIMMWNKWNEFFTLKGLNVSFLKRLSSRVYQWSKKVLIEPVEKDQVVCFTKHWSWQRVGKSPEPQTCTCTIWALSGSLGCDPNENSGKWQCVTLI